MKILNMFKIILIFSFGVFIHSYAFANPWGALNTETAMRNSVQPLNQQYKKMETVPVYPQTENAIETLLLFNQNQYFLNTSDYAPVFSILSNTNKNKAIIQTNICFIILNTKQNQWGQMERILLNIPASFEMKIQTVMYREWWKCMQHNKAIAYLQEKTIDTHYIALEHGIPPQSFRDTFSGHITLEKYLHFMQTGMDEDYRLYQHKGGILFSFLYSQLREQYNYNVLLTLSHFEPYPVQQFFLDIEHIRPAISDIQTIIAITEKYQVQYGVLPLKRKIVSKSNKTKKKP